MGSLHFDQFAERFLGLILTNRIEREKMRVVCLAGTREALECRSVTVLKSLRTRKSIMLSDARTSFRERNRDKMGVSGTLILY